MSELVLLTAADCHLCAHGRGVLEALDVDWHEISDDSQQGEALAVTAPPMRPVLFGSDGRVLAYGRLSLKRLRRQFRASEAVRPNG